MLNHASRVPNLITNCESMYKFHLTSAWGLVSSITRQTALVVPTPPDHDHIHGEATSHGCSTSSSGSSVHRTGYRTLSRPPPPPLAFSPRRPRPSPWAKAPGECTGASMHPSPSPHAWADVVRSVATSCVILLQFCVLK